MAELAEPPVASKAVTRFLTFAVDERRFALPADQVTEVIQVPAAARVPQGPPALIGIANLRGAVLPLVDLRELLSLPRKRDGAPANKAIVIDGAAPTALVVDRVDALVSVEASRIDSREAELAAQPGEALTGAFKVEADGKVAKILDIRKLLAAAFARHARAQRSASRAQSRGRVDLGTAELSEKLVTFEVAGQEYALAIDQVQEILPSPTGLTLVPRTEDLVLGVTTLRDKLLPLLSLRGLLGFPAAETDGREKVVVTKVGGAQVGLLADRARAVLAADASAIDAIPPTLAARTGGESRIKAIYRGDAGRRLISILAPEQLFREDVMQRLHSVAAADAAPRDASAQASELKFLVFRLESDEFALPIDAVSEIGLVPARITKVPKTPKFLEGVINLRGEVLPLVDQRRRFDLPPSAQPEARRVVVVKTHEHRAGLIVDGVSDVLRVPADSVEPPPPLTEDIARLVRGVINLEAAQRMVLVLDPAELLTPAERRLLDAFQKAGQAGA
jgi:purine-binding chemotaxis protein CheW